MIHFVKNSVILIKLVSTFSSKGIQWLLTFKKECIPKIVNGII